MSDYLKKEDYEEPCCPLQMKKTGERIPMMRVIETLDMYQDQKNFTAAKRHLKYWLEEARRVHDTQGKLSVLNEQIGFYRKQGQKTECLQAIEGALSTLKEIKTTDSAIYGTTLVNAATGYKACGMPEEAMPLYRRAQEVYEAILEPNDGRTGALYNNMALALTELKQYREAEAYYFKAIEIMKHQQYGELEQAITYLNLADLLNDEIGLLEADEKINEYVHLAYDLLDTPGIPRNGYYAFVAENCADVFGYYGFFVMKNELTERAREIYERA